MMSRWLAILSFSFLLGACATESGRSARRANNKNEKTAWDSGETAFDKKADKAEKTAKDWGSEGPPEEEDFAPASARHKKDKWDNEAGPDEGFAEREPGSDDTEGDSEQGYTSGTLYFFDRDDRSIVKNFDAGLDVGGIRWGKAISSGNPGVDCTLKLRKQGPPSNSYACVIREGKHAIVVNMTEAMAGKRALTTISVDAKGKNTLTRWQKELETMGFEKTGQAPSGRLQKWQFASKDGRSAAELIFAPRANAVTVVFKAQAAEAERETASVSRHHKKHAKNKKWHKAKHAKKHTAKKARRAASASHQNEEATDVGTGGEDEAPGGL